MKQTDSKPNLGPMHVTEEFMSILPLFWLIFTYILFILAEKERETDSPKDHEKKE